MPSENHPAYDRLGLAAACVAPLGWGLTGIFVRLLSSLPPLAIVVGRLLVAAAALGILLLIRRPGRVKPRWSLPALAMAGYYILATEAFARAAVVEVTLLIGMAPVLALGIERLQGRRVPLQRLVGVVLALGGLIGFLAADEIRINAKLSGDMLALGAAAASAMYATRLRELARTNSAPDPTYVAGVACVVGALAGAMLASILGSLTVQALTPRDARTLLLLGALSTAIPTLAYSVASIRLPAVLTTSLGLATPLFAAVFAGTVLGEWPALSALPGALTALAGLALVVRSGDPTRDSQLHLGARS